jgi:HAE1 family hydrophobic/amphiphilic exporter-1
MDKIVGELTGKYKDLLIFTQDLSLNGMSASRGFPIEVTIQGKEWKKLVKLSSEFISSLKSSALVTDLNSDYQGEIPEIDVIPKRFEAAQRGVSIQSMSSSVGTLIGGAIFDSGTQYPKDNHRYDIRVRSEKGFYSNEKNIQKVLLRNNRGVNTELLPISQVAEIKNNLAQQSITRLNRERAIPFFANVKSGKSQLTVLDYIGKTAKKILPAGYHLVITGGAQTFLESFSGLFFALILGVVVAYMVLASQFNSFIHPFTVLLALPFSLTGALLALLMTDQSLNLFSMMGLILLMGIVKKNSIILVDFTNEKRKHSKSVDDALLEACPIRLRPILMTSIACIVGAIPAAISFGPGSETRAPMAVAIIGGVTLSTLLTLIVVPCAYSVLARFEKQQDMDKLLEEEDMGIVAGEVIP